MGQVFRVPHRLYWVADRSRLVRHGDPDAAFLAFTAGQELSDEEARRHGLVPVEEKSQPPTENKLGARPADKAAPRMVKEKTS
jgi:hypothetical protein